ncbi:gliding motility-associated C-terminal domain-containing protein [Flavobacterium sp.]|jgi:gliding motility-associated-like protein|uniref:gliding motility-associated C-terminal domain-containing protein n=1 Tax=Flavobacterium sp. TaxID=239 RepID=UPI0037BE93D5
MKRKYNYFLLWLLHFFAFSVWGQEVSLYQQFNGRYDFTFVGNTLNPAENSFQTSQEILASSAAELSLNSDDTLLKAYLYWAGSGDGDFEVELNGESFTAARTFSLIRNFNGVDFTFFSAFADITDFIATTGNGVYTFSGLDNLSFLPLHFQRRTNFAGWAIILVYYNASLPLNQINLYDGLESVPEELNISLNSLNVIDNQGAKIGFLAWEGDVGILVNETLRINGTILSNPPLNPENNAFNGTNSITGSSALFNMDLDIYDIQNNIQPGDQSAEIALTSGQDFVMINAVVTKLNSQVPDATIVIDNVFLSCNSNEVTVDYTVYNLNATNPLPANTPIAVYVNGVVIASAATMNVIAIDGSESNSITLLLPEGITSSFELVFAVDDIGNGTGIVIEISDANNTAMQEVTLLVSPIIPALKALLVCNEGFSRGTFDLNPVLNELSGTEMLAVTAHETLEEAELGTNAILSTGNYSAETPKTLYLRIENEPCPSVAPLPLAVENCPPTVYNFISANEDGWNDYFFIDGLRDIFLNFELAVYNRWGYLIWKGNQNTADWRGEVTEEIKWNGNIAPDGTYFYVLHLNDPNYSQPYQGFLYITR